MTECVADVKERECVVCGHVAFDQWVMVETDIGLLCPTCYRCEYITCCNDPVVQADCCPLNKWPNK